MCIARRCIPARSRARGPRYCPSIEDKIVRFGDRDGHQIFLEPEGPRRQHGLSERHLDLAAGGGPAGDPGDHPGSRAGQDGPAGLRDRIRPRRSPRTGSDRCRPGGCRGSSWPARSTAPPATKRRPRKGIVAGLNAALAASGAAPIVFDRADGYLGVMIDDLVTRGITEPYRMFTSRAEYRLTLAGRQRRPAPDRQGALRWAASGRRVRSATAPRWPRSSAAKSLAKSLTITPNEAARHGLALNRDGHRRSAFELLAYPEVEWTATARHLAGAVGH